MFGNFSGPKAQEIVVARNNILELLRPDSDSGKVVSVLQWEVFGVIRSVLAFRLVGKLYIKKHIKYKPQT